MPELIDKLRRNTPTFMTLLGVELVSATLDRMRLVLDRHRGTVARCSAIREPLQVLLVDRYRFFS